MTGEDDLPAVHALQIGLRLTALRDWSGSGPALAPAAPLRAPRRPDTTTAHALLFSEELCETLKDITVRDDEVAFARQLEAIGITLADGFRTDTLDAPTLAGLERAVLDGQTLAAHKARDLMPRQSGGTWTSGADLTSLDDWWQRAGVGFGYLWADLGSEILFPMVRTDAAGQPLSGANRYRLHFAAGELPPARYWRISMYDLEGFFVDNPAGRYGIGNMAEHLQPDPDGGLTIHIATGSPTDSEPGNWLPAPAEGFFMVMRLYQPEERMYRGECTIPPVERID